MKKKCLLLAVLPLICACGGDNIIPSEDEFIANAIEAFKANSYVVDTNFVTEIYRKDATAGDQYQPLSIRRTENYNLSYQLGDDAAIKITSDAKHEDLFLNEDGTYSVINTNVYTDEDSVYFRDDESGYAIKETLSIDNEVTELIMSDYEEYYGTYVPIEFDSEFKNPFDYLQASDFAKNEEGTYYLNGTKAVFLAKCFQRSSLTYATDALVEFDEDGHFSSITIDIAYVDADAYTQQSTYTCVFSEIGNVEINHIHAYDNSNPEIESLFAKAKAAQTYTYFKGYGTEDSGYEDDVTCFYTQDVVLFHHFYKDYPTALYDGGYDYDYKVEYDEDDKTYYAYEYNKASDSVPYAWALCYLSGTTPLTYETFQDIGPTFYKISPALFYKNEDGSYSVVDELLSTIGAYFDNQFIGVHSDVLDGACTSFKMTLDGEKGFTVELSYHSENKEHYITFALSDIDATIIPFEI